MSHNNERLVSGYLPDERPSFGKLIIFAIQHILVMFPATVMVAILTGFHVSTTIFASGFATLCFLFVTKGKIPLYYGSSFSYITAIVGITGGVAAGKIVAPDALISQAQFGIIASGFVSILAGIIVNKFGQARIEKILPASITGSIAIIIGLSLAGNAMTGALGYDAATDTMSIKAAIAGMVTLTTTILFSVYLKKGVLGQIPILLGILVGYAVSIAMGMVDFSLIFKGEILSTPHFTLPTPNWAAVWAIMPIAIATIPESTAHLFQLDAYVNNFAERKGSKKRYNIGDKLGSNLIGDGIGDIVSSIFGGPAGTNYGENISTMAITNNFSIWVLGAAAIITMVMSFIQPFSNLVLSIPSPVINGAGIYLFGVIGAQGIAILINKNVDLFDAQNLAVIAIILVIGLGGHFAFPGGMIPIANLRLPSIATASIVGIVFNAMLSLSKDDK